MVDFRSGYQPPGVYVSADNSAVTSALGVNPTVVCLVGSGLGYQTYTDRLVFASLSTTLPLSQFGIQQSSIAVSYVDTNGVTQNLALTTDYTVSSTNGSYPDAQTTITPVNSGALPVNTTILVNYRYANSNYFAVNRFSDFTSLTNVYGAPFNTTTGALQSPLSLAAQIAFENGANEIYTVSVDGLGSLSDQFKNAYALTETLPQINVLVPVFKEGTIADANAFTPYITGLNAHLQTTDNNGTPRIAVVSVPSDFSNSVSPDTVASTFNYKRVVFVWPKELLYYNSVTNQTITIGGSYAAAACAGFLANNPVNQGLTRRQLRSLVGISLTASRASTTSNKNLWSSKGVAVIEINRLGQLVIRHGTTTDTSTVVSRELNIVRCQDALYNIIQQSLDQAELIGTPITDETPFAVKAIIASALETAKSTNTIQDYNNLVVRQQALPNGDPTVIEARFSYKPTFPVNYITVVISLDLNTGNLTTSIDTAAQ